MDRDHNIRLKYWGRRICLHWIYIYLSIQTAVLLHGPPSTTGCIYIYIYIYRRSTLRRFYFTASIYYIIYIYIYIDGSSTPWPSVYYTMYIYIYIYIYLYRCSTSRRSIYYRIYVGLFDGSFTPRPSVYCWTNIYMYTYIYIGVILHGRPSTTKDISFYFDGTPKCQIYQTEYQLQRLTYSTCPSTSCSTHRILRPPHAQSIAPAHAPRA